MSSYHTGYLYLHSYFYSLSITVFIIQLYRQILTLFFWTRTIGLIHVVAFSACSIISNTSNLWSSFSTGGFKWCGILLHFCHTGPISLLIWRFSWEFFILRMPLNTFSYYSNKLVSTCNICSINATKPSFPECFTTQQCLRISTDHLKILIYFIFLWQLMWQ